MQQLILHKKLYTIRRIDTNEYSQTVWNRLEKIRLFKKARCEGCSLKTASSALDVPLSTIYRWNKKYKCEGLVGLENGDRGPHRVREKTWDRYTINQVLYLRKQNPLYGKYKIAYLLKRDRHMSVSVSTVGRIISYLIKRGSIRPASFYYAKKRVRPRVFRGHAQRWKRGMKAQVPGELLQIDHMKISVTSGFQVKHFQAICPVTKIAVKQAYSRATSNIAKQFLELAIKNLPFEIKSIQVDGGSEFMKDFEQACKDLHIPLFVLPPKSPEYNGNVERANGTSKFEFYACYDGQISLFT